MSRLNPLFYAVSKWRLTPCLGAETHGLKFRSEATQPMCLRPSESASDYSRLLGEHSFTTAKPKSMLATIYPYSFLDKLPVLYWALADSWSHASPHFASGILRSRVSRYCWSESIVWPFWIELFAQRLKAYSTANLSTLGNPTNSTSQANTLLPEVSV